MVPEAGKFCLEQNLAAQLACKAEHRMCEPPEPGTGSRHAKKFLTKGTLKRKTKMVPRPHWDNALQAFIYMGIKYYLEFCAPKCAPKLSGSPSLSWFSSILY